MKIGRQLLGMLREEKNKAVESKQKDKFIFLQHREDDCQFQIKFKDIDRYGIVLEYITLTRGTPVLDLDVLKQKLENQAEKVQKTITYLLEDFKLIELDRMNKRAQLRSYPPHEKEDSKFYYEIVLDEGIRIHFQRYQYNSTNRRFEKITSQLTLETFERLIDDLAETLCD